MTSKRCEIWAACLSLWLGMVAAWSPRITCAEEVAGSTKAVVDDLVLPILKWHRSAMLVVSICRAGEPEEFFGYRGEQSKAKEPDEDSIFQVGSVTKLFTGLLLAIAVENKELALSDPVAKSLPAAFEVPKRGMHDITLEELATHTSGLPRLPNDFILSLTLGMVPANNPYSTITQASLARSLKQCDPGEKESPEYAYSNLGMGLLGHAVCHQAGLDYETLLRRRITGPLGLKDTVVLLSDEQKTRFVGGQDATGKKLPMWTFGMLEGAGALSSTTRDLQRFLAAESGRLDSPLKSAMLLTQESRRRVTDGLQLGLAWHISGPLERRMWWHNGATFGHSSFVAFCHEPELTVVVLCNEGAGGLSGQTMADRVGFPLMKKLMAEKKAESPRAD
ncbi:serine hydrolase domain-containing protein [Planctomicrobium piriforme]|uniref:CubicO group peptidase, beta-lactamase class C family n=1 Tax=Planctomicrobium piriforme TaxID=1576369 RepID=A0A1I3LRK1_9PLAN|nr:serine hydrolase domain-containing protein [Planctomicrobium piriforme]SFI87086.1 CubicO group peptidase, beta-lactamase class C family [Planctomicrobium piriforme]